MGERGICAVRQSEKWTSEERRSLAPMVAVIALLNIVGWGVLALVVVPQQLSIGGAGFWFSLGHSSVVAAFCTLIVLGIRTGGASGGS